MHFERLTSADDPRFSAAMEGYAVSFPPHEQREPALQRAIMTDPAYRFNLIYDGGAPVGAADMWAAIFADVGVMVLAVLNAIRALQVHNL